MITYTNQYIHKFKNDECFDSAQTLCIYWIQVKIR